MYKDTVLKVLIIRYIKTSKGLRYNNIMRKFKLCGNATRKSLAELILDNYLYVDELGFFQINATYPDTLIYKQ